MGTWTLKLELTSRTGERYTRCIDLPAETIFSGMSPRLREELEMASEVGMGVPGMTFDGMVDMMKRREFRRKDFVAVTRQLAEQMADHMEDREGWHGMDRAERAAKC